MLSKGWGRIREDSPVFRNYIRWFRTKRTFRSQRISGRFCSPASVRSDPRYDESCRAYTGHDSGGNCSGHRKTSRTYAHRRISSCRSTASSSNSSSCRTARIEDAVWLSASEVLAVLTLSSYFVPVWNGGIEQQYGPCHRVRTCPAPCLRGKAEGHTHVFSSRDCWIILFVYQNDLADSSIHRGFFA